MFDFYYRTQAGNITKGEKLQNSNCPFRFFFEYFRLCSLCSKYFLVLLLLLVGSLVPKIHCQLTKKSLREGPEKVGHSTIW